MSKIHKKTGIKCLICEEQCIGIILHKTQRQTHKLCNDCFLGYISPKIDIIMDKLRINIRKNSQYIKCCGNILSQHRNNCKTLIDITKLDISQLPSINIKILTINLLTSNENMFLCPNKKCNDVVEISPDYFFNFVKCFGCDTNWCNQCNVSPFHTDKTCLEYEVEFQTTENGKYIQNMIKEGKMKLCPLCKTPIYRSSGCNHMVCGSCSTHWCWLCSNMNVGYDHYNMDNGSVTCKGKLWEGTESII